MGGSNMTRRGEDEDTLDLSGDVRREYPIFPIGLSSHRKPASNEKHKHEDRGPESAKLAKLQLPSFLFGLSFPPL